MNPEPTPPVSPDPNESRPFRCGRGPFGKPWINCVSIGLNIFFIIFLLAHALGGHHRPPPPGAGGPDREGYQANGSMGEMEKMMMFMMMMREMDRPPQMGPPPMGMPGMPQGGPGMSGMPGMDMARMHEMMMHGPGGPGFGGPGGPGGPGGFGGPGEGHPNLVDGMLHGLSDHLRLNDDEKAKVKQILEDEIKDFKQKIRPDLTPDQQKVLDEGPEAGH